MAGDKRSGGGDGVLTKLARDEVKGMRFQRIFVSICGQVDCWGEGRRRMIVDEFGQ